MMKKIVVVICMLMISGPLYACGTNTTDTNTDAGTNAEENDVLGNSDVDIDALLENASLATDHKEYDLAAGYYEEILNADTSVLEARYGLEDLFKISMSHSDYELAQDIYSYVYNLNSEDVSLSRFQDIVIEYDKRELNMLTMGFSDTFIYIQRSYPQNISYFTDRDMEVTAFYDALNLAELDYGGYTKEWVIEELSRIVYFDSEGNLTFDNEVYIQVFEFNEDFTDIRTYIKDSVDPETGECIEDRQSYT